MVEIGAGEVIFGSPKLDVTLLADIEQLAAVDVRAAPGWGNSSPHVHARHAEALYVFEGELTLQLEDRAHSIGPETWAFVPREIAHTFEVTGDTAGAVPRPPRSGLGLRRLHPWRRQLRSTSCPRSMPSHVTPVSSSSAERAEPRATTSPTGRSDEPPCSSRPRRSRSPSSTTGRASAARRGMSIESTRTRSSSSTASSRSTCATARTRCRPARSSSSRPASCTASTTTRTRIPAPSTSTCRRSASPTTCAVGTPPSTSSTRPRTAASTRAAVVVARLSG